MTDLPARQRSVRSWVIYAAHPIPEGELIEVVPRAERDRLSEIEDALRELADEAARVVCEPRRFHENEDDRQQRLGQAVAKARLSLRGTPRTGSHGA